MKAILLAGGEGTRLRPLTSDLPKPMVPLFGRPVLEHLILLLRSHGITDIAMTLGYLPDRITEHFGDGRKWGVSLTYFTEETPMGTAGGVRACLPFLRGEDCIVLSGDCVCDFDLTRCIRRHRQRQAEATILLHRVEEPTEYGLVQTDEHGRVIRFAEKPSWSQVFTDRVNTGIYLLSHSVIESIPPDTVWDFSRDLFPRMLEEGRPLFGDLTRGRWLDMGSIASYRQTLREALDGSLRLELSCPQQREGVYAHGLVPEDVTVLPPCWIGADVVLEKDCLIGPYTVLERNTRVGSGSVVQRSALLGCTVGSGNTIDGSILCHGSETDAGVTLHENVALGSGVRIAEGVTLREQVRIGSQQTVSGGDEAGLAPDSRPRRFDASGTMCGALWREMTPEFLLRLGGLLAGEGGCGLGCGGGDGAKTLALAAEAGITAAGGDVFLHDGSTPASAAGYGADRRHPVSLYLWQQGDAVSLLLSGPSGLPLPARALRQLERKLATAGQTQPSAARPGKVQQVSGADLRYLDAACRYCPFPISPQTVFVSQDNRAGQLLAESLRRIGCQVSKREGEGVPAFFAQPDGFGLSLRTESGRLLPPEWVQMLCCLLLLEAGERTLALSASAPALAERLAAVYGGRILRLGRDGEEAERCHARLLPLRDSCAAACLVIGHLAVRGQRLEGLTARLPHFALRRREVTLALRGSAMDALTRAFSHSEVMGDGIRVTAGGGSAWLSPAEGQSALSIVAEGPTEEFAAELCDFITEKAKEADHL